MAEFKNELILQDASGVKVSIDLRNALVLSSAPTTATKARVGMQAYVVSGGAITEEYVCTAVSGGVYTWVLREMSSGGTDAALEGKVDDLEAAVTEDGGNSQELWEQGSIGDSGNMVNSTLRLRTTGYISQFVAKVHTNYPYSFKVYAYNDAGTYVGVWNGSGFAKSGSVWIRELDLSQFGGMNYRYRVTFRRDNDATITPESYTYINFTNAIYSDIEAVRTESAEKTDELFEAVADDMNNATLWVKGGIAETGSEYPATNVVRTASYIPDGVKLIYAKGNWIFMAFLYDVNDILVGVWGGTGIIQTASKWLYYLMPEHLSGYKIRLIARRRDSADITVNDVVADVHFLNEIHAKAFCRTPTLTFIDDDGSLNSLENWESITDEIGVKITSALVTGVMRNGESNPQKLSWEDVARLQNKGYEFVSHTHNHINIIDSTADVVVEQFESSIAALREHGCESRYLVYPYNKINSAKMPLVKKYFSAAVGLGQETENILPVQTHDLKRVSINSDALIDKEYNGESVQVAGFRSLDELKGYIDRTLINGGWLIIMTHLRNDNSYYHDDASRTMIIDLCKYAVENGMLIQTFGEAFQRYKNIMETGTVNDSTYYITDCNGVVRYR